MKHEIEPKSISLIIQTKQKTINLRLDLSKWERNITVTPGKYERC